MKTSVFPTTPLFVHIVFTYDLQWIELFLN